MGRAIPYWLILRVGTHPPRYYRLDVHGNFSLTSDPKLALRHFEREGAADLARALGPEWVEHLEMFEGTAPVVTHHG